MFLFTRRRRTISICKKKHVLWFQCRYQILGLLSEETGSLDIDIAEITFKSDVKLYYQSINRQIYWFLCLYRLFGYIYTFGFIPGRLAIVYNEWKLRSPAWGTSHSTINGGQPWMLVNWTKYPVNNLNPHLLDNII